MNINFKDFFLSLSREERYSYAKRAGTTDHYIQTHLINRYKIPRSKLMNDLAEASDGLFTTQELASFFYVNDKAA